MDSWLAERAEAARLRSGPQLENNAETWETPQRSPQKQKAEIDPNASQGRKPLDSLRDSAEPQRKSRSATRLRRAAEEGIIQSDSNQRTRIGSRAGNDGLTLKQKDDDRNNTPGEWGP